MQVAQFFHVMAHDEDSAYPIARAGAERDRGSGASYTTHSLFAGTVWLTCYTASQNAAPEKEMTPHAPTPTLPATDARA
ncbi:MAG: hypothetical protein ACM3N4_05655 [Nitrososphaerota archaeon]